ASKKPFLSAASLRMTQVRQPETMLDLSDSRLETLQAVPRKMTIVFKGLERAKQSAAEKNRPGRFPTVPQGQSTM
ncbi:MAG TPA: hypothetical protein VLT88_03095, partial [Desulfosarcina sp.]|nr:hypothetical protein [Desulfosarcina sp.]